MKYLLIVIIAMLTACTIATQTEYTINDNVAKLAVGNDATDSLLTAIAEEFKVKKGIEIDFSESKFDEYGRITYLNLNVKVGGSGGGVESVYTPTTQERSGFKVEYNTKNGTVLMTGVMD